MINVDQARELVAAADIPFPQDWRDQMLKVSEDAINKAAKTGRKSVAVHGKVNDRGTYQNFFITPEQFTEIVATLKQNGFRVDEYFKIRHDGQPLYIDIFW